MELNFLLQLLDDWSKWMRHDNHKLGYPSKSIGLSSGGSSNADTFDYMIEDLDNDNVRTIDALIHSLPIEEQNAIYARYLHTKKPFYYELKLQFALDKLLIKAEQRIPY